MWPRSFLDLEPERSGLRDHLLDNALGEDLTDLGERIPACQTFTTATNLGFGGGHNLLASKTEAPYLLILNPDVEFLFPSPRGACWRPS